jgi:hypothetical protein
VKVTWRRALALTGPASPLVTGGGTATFVLTASSAADVSQTSHPIEIFDADSGIRLASCNTGKTCSAHVTVGDSVKHNYIAYVASASATSPPPDVQAKSNVFSVQFTPVK